MEVEIVNESPYDQAENGDESRGGGQKACTINHAMILIGSGQTRINADACDDPGQANTKTIPRIT